MKVAIVFVALVAACSAMSFKEQILQQVENAQMAKRTENGDGDNDDWAFPVMLEFASLVGKCEAFTFFYSKITEKRADQEPVLLWMCPHVLDFGRKLTEGDEDEQEEVAVELAGHFYLMQCANLMSEVEMLKFIGFTDGEETELTSKLLVHGQPLFAECQKMFGDVRSEADKVDKTLDDTKVDSRSESLLNLVRQLKLTLRK